MSSSLESVSYLQRAYKADSLTCYNLKLPEPMYAYVKCKKTIKTTIRSEVGDGEYVVKLFGVFDILRINRTKMVEDTDIKKVYGVEFPNASIERFVERLTRDLAGSTKPIVHKGKFLGTLTEKEETGTVSIRVAPKIYEHEDKIVIAWIRKD